MRPTDRANRVTLRCGALGLLWVWRHAGGIGEGRVDMKVADQHVGVVILCPRPIATSRADHRKAEPGHGTDPTLPTHPVDWPRESARWAVRVDSCVRVPNVSRHWSDLVPTNGAQRKAHGVARERGCWQGQSRWVGRDQAASRAWSRAATVITAISSGRGVSGPTRPTNSVAGVPTRQSTVWWEALITHHTRVFLWG